MSALRAVFTTVGDLSTAERMAHAIVEEKLAACVQITEIRSFYQWQGAVQHEPEVRLLCKTTAEKAPALQEAIVAMHPYELPAVFSTAVVAAYEPYADWVAASTHT